MFTFDFGIKGRFLNILKNTHKARHRARPDALVLEPLEGRALLTAVTHTAFVVTNMNTAETVAGQTIDFGEAYQGNNANTLSFSVQNTGDHRLRHLSIKLPAGFMFASDKPPRSLAPGESATFALSMSVKKPGDHVGQLVFKAGGQSLKALASGVVYGRFEVTEGHAGRFTDARGAIAVMTLTGPGNAVVTYIAGANKRLTDIVVDGTTSESHFTLSVAQRSPVNASIPDVHVYTPLGSFTAPQLDISHTFRADAELASLSLGDIDGFEHMGANGEAFGASITLAGTINSPPVNVSLGRLTNAGFSSGEPVGSFTANQYRTYNAPHGTLAITAPSFDSIYFYLDFSGAIIAEQSIGTASFGALTDATIAAGSGNPLPGNSIGSIEVRGTIHVVSPGFEEPPSFINSAIYAYSIGSVTLKTVDATADHDFGIFANQVGSFSARAGLGDAPVSLTNLTTPGDSFRYQQFVVQINPTVVVDPPPIHEPPVILAPPSVLVTGSRPDDAQPLTISDSISGIYPSFYSGPLLGIIRSADELGPDSGLTVDFNTQMVVVLVMGTQSSGGYSTQITAVYHDGDRLWVDAVESSPGPGIITTQSLNNPYAMVVVDRIDGVTPVLHKDQIEVSLPALVPPDGAEPLAFSSVPSTDAESGTSLFSVRVIRSAAELGTLTPPPDVDFSHQIIVYVSAGVQNRGVSVAVTGVYHTGNGLWVGVTETRPVVFGGTPDPVYPYTMAVLERIDFDSVYTNLSLPLA